MRVHNILSGQQLEPQHAVVEEEEEEEEGEEEEIPMEPLKC